MAMSAVVGHTCPEFQLHDLEDVPLVQPPIHIVLYRLGPLRGTAITSVSPVFTVNKIPPHFKPILPV